MIGKFAMFCRNMLDWFKSDRCFIKYFIDAFGYVNKNMLLVMLIVLFTYAITLYVLISAVHGTSSIIMLTILTLLSSAMASGLFYSIKKSIENSDEDNSKTTFGTFYSGVGKHYLSFLGIMFLFFILTTGVIALTFILANTFICNISELGVSIRDFFYILADPSIGAPVFEQLSKTQQTHFRDWNRIFFITTQIFTVLMMYWIPEKMYTQKNIFVSLFGGIKKVITDLPNTVCIYLTILLLNFIISAPIPFFSNVAIVAFILSILSIYLLVYDFYVIFLYYKAKYINVYERGEIE